MTARAQLPAMRVGEIRKLTFDFISDLAAGETISTQTVTASVYSGTDASPSGLISGSATASGTVVTQAVTAAGKTAGVIYELLCTITTSTSQTLKKAGYLALVANL